MISVCQRLFITDMSLAIQFLTRSCSYPLFRIDYETMLLFTFLACCYMHIFDVFFSTNRNVLIFVENKYDSTNYIYSSTSVSKPPDYTEATLFCTSTSPSSSTIWWYHSHLIQSRRKSQNDWICFPFDVRQSLILLPVGSMSRIEQVVHKCWNCSLFVPCFSSPFTRAIPPWHTTLNSLRCLILLVPLINKFSIVYFLNSIHSPLDTTSQTNAGIACCSFHASPLPLHKPFHLDIQHWIACAVWSYWYL